MKVTLIPVRISQTIPPIDAVQLPDGRLGATLRSLCRVLSIDSRSQLARIRRHPKLSEALAFAPIQFGSTTIQMDILLHWAIPTWAVGLNVSRLPEAKRPAAMILQQEAFTAIEQAFTQRENSNTPPPETSTPKPSPNVIDQFRQGFALITEGLTTLVIEQHDLKERVTALEGGPAQSIVGVSPQRLLQIYTLAHRVRQRHGYRIADTLAGLADHFRVEDVFDLAESDWSAILDWFAGVLAD